MRSRRGVYWTIKGGELPSLTSCHVWMRHVMYESVVSRLKESCHIWMTAHMPTWLCHSTFGFHAHSYESWRVVSIRDCVMSRMKASRHENCSNRGAKKNPSTGECIKLDPSRGECIILLILLILLILCSPTLLLGQWSDPTGARQLRAKAAAARPASSCVTHMPCTRSIFFVQMGASIQISTQHQMPSQNLVRSRIIREGVSAQRLRS